MSSAPSKAACSLDDHGAFLAWCVRFGSSICFGITMGLWLAGVIDLVQVEAVVATLLTAIWMAPLRV